MYFERSKYFDFAQVEWRKIDDLQDDRPHDFKVHGLRNLVREVGRIIQKCGGRELVVIDATGGYKAQIAVAVLIGQALDIPVCYKHERFSRIIEFPPLPVMLDYYFWRRYNSLFARLSRQNASVSEVEFFMLVPEEDDRHKLSVFLNRELIEGEAPCTNSTLSAKFTSLLLN